MDLLLPLPFILFCHLCLSSSSKKKEFSYGSHGVSSPSFFFFFFYKIRKILQVKKKFSTFFHFENFWSSKNFVTRLFLNTNWFALKYKMRCLNPTSVSHLFCFICSYSFYEHPLGVDIQFSVIDINLFPSSFMLQWTSKFSLFVASKHMCTFYSWSELLWTLVDTFFFLPLSIDSSCD